MRDQNHIITAFVVDDEPLIATTLAKILDLNGFYAKPFFSASGALSDAAEFGPPEILITDVLMPEMNGIDLATNFLKLYPLCKTLLISGQVATADLLSDAKRAGHDFRALAKPFPPEDLIAAAHQLLDAS
jgi:DNA-binding NtrC family response regulator